MEAEEAGAEAPAVMAADSTPMPAMPARPSGRNRRLDAGTLDEAAQTIREMQPGRAMAEEAQSALSRSAAATEPRKPVRKKESLERLREARELSQTRPASPAQKKLTPQKAEESPAKATFAPPARSESPPAPNRKF